MQYELQAATESGRRLVTLAETLADDFATRADEHDREGSYPFENIEALKAAGYLAAPIPRGFGGLGVDSIHDLLVASARLARGDASVTIGLNMHLLALVNMVRAWRVASAGGDPAIVAALTRALERIAANKVVFAALISEPNQNISRPATTAKPTRAGWVINGMKVFGTMSPAATVFNVGVTIQAEDGSERYGFALVPPDAPGVTPLDDWDALGMRASGSGSVRFENVRVPHAAVRAMFPAGTWSEGFLERYLPSGPFHAAASLGIAEAAQQQAVAFVTSRPAPPAGRRAVERPRLQMLAAENAVDLAAARATLARAGTLIDGYYATHWASPASVAELHAVFKEAQCAKTFVHGAAMRTVDRALTMSGGAGYMNRNRLSRLYRDVRAGPFMHPIGDNMVHEYIGQVTLGVEPSLA